jgi:hypothetical protein
MASFIVILFYLIQLDGVDNVVPDAVEAAGNSRDGRKEGVGEPDEENGVFLSQ